MKTVNKIFPEINESMAASLSEEKILLDGMEVLFDTKVGLYPVRLAKAVRLSNKRVKNGSPKKQGS